MAPKEIPITNADISNSITIPGYQANCLKHSATSFVNRLHVSIKHKDKCQSGPLTSTNTYPTRTHVNCVVIIQFSIFIQTFNDNSRRWDAAHVTPGPIVLNLRYFYRPSGGTSLKINIGAENRYSLPTFCNFDTKMSLIAVFFSLSNLAFPSQIATLLASIASINF